MVEEGDITFYQDSLRNYQALSNHIRRQFELIMPESMRKTYRLVDGEDLDLNATLEAWVDLKMNIPPDDKDLLAPQPEPPGCRGGFPAGHERLHR